MEIGKGKKELKPFGIVKIQTIWQVGFSIGVFGIMFGTLNPKYKKFHKKNFKRHLENNEYIHNKMILEKRRDLESNKDKYQKETNLFHFSKLKTFEENNNNN